MKKLFLLVILILPTTFVGALEIGTYFDIGNMSFLEKPLTGTSFPSDKYPWGITLEGSQAIGEGTAVEVLYTNDRIVNNLVQSIFRFNGEFFSIAAGPSFGVLNSTEVPLQPGMTTQFEVSWPGRLFISFDMLSSMGVRLSSTGDYSQSLNNLTVGFYVPNAICTIGMDQKTYTEVTASYGEGTDKQTDYSFKADIFQKNVPFRILIGLIYRQHTKDYIQDVITGTVSDISDPNFDLALTSMGITESLNSILLQSKVTFTFSPALTMILDIHTNLFSFGKIVNDEADTSELMSIPTDLPESFLFEAELGVVYTF